MWLVSRRDRTMEDEKDKLRKEQLRKDDEDKRRFDEMQKEFRKADKVKVDAIGMAYFLAFMTGTVIALLVTS